MRVAKSWVQSQINRTLLIIALSAVTALTPRHVSAQDATFVPWGQLTPTESRDRLHDDPTAGAVVVFDRGLITVGPGFRFTYERHRRVQIFRADAYRFANVEIPHHVSERIVRIEAHTLTPDNRTVEVPLDKIRETQVGDRVSSVFAFPEVSPKCVVEYRYWLSSDNFYFLRPWVFQNDIPTEYSELSVRLPEGFEYESVLNNTDFVRGPDTTYIPSLRYEGGKIRQFTWHAHALPPIMAEPCVPSLMDYRVQIDFQIVRFREKEKIWEFVDSWTDLAGQVRKVYRPLLRHEDTWPTLGKIPEAVPDVVRARRALLERVYQFVRDSVVSSGEASSVIAPELLSARAVMVQRRGNPIEKNLLLVSLLRYHGLAAYPVLISRRDHLRFDGRDHRLDQFNHILVMVDLGGDRVFCDVNVPVAWPGYLPPEDQVEAGILIDFPHADDDHNVVLEIPGPLVGNEVTGVANIELRADGSAHGHLEAHVAGQAAYELLRALADRDTLGYLHAQWLPEISLVSFTIDRDPENGWAPIKFAAEFEWPEAATVDDSRLFLRPAMLRKLDNNPLMTSFRHYPISFDSPWSENCRIIWRLPEGFTLNDLPGSREMLGDGFEFRASILRDDSGQVVATRIWRVTHRDFPVVRFSELRELFSAVQLSQRGLMVLYRDSH